jgi:hypothetical protein
MNPRVTRVQANDDYTLVLTFTNGEMRLFDMKPYLNHGIFSELKDLKYFKSVRPVWGTVQWPHEQDVCPDSLYEQSVPYRGTPYNNRLRRPFASLHHPRPGKKLGQGASGVRTSDRRRSRRPPAAELHRTTRKQAR